MTVRRTWSSGGEAMEQFKKLEEKIRLAAERLQHFKAVRQELEKQVDDLRKERKSLRGRISELEAELKNTATSTTELDHLREERSEIARRVETLIGELSDLGLEEGPPAKAKRAAAGG
jgi:chromosome segregation ATPase